MKIEALDQRYRDAVNLYIKEEWSGPTVVSRGNLYDSSNLPGFMALDEDGGLMGAILYHFVDGDCEIAILFSLAENKGAATALIDTVIEEAKKADCNRIWLITTNDNTHAIRFYQRRGFDLRAVHIGAFEVTRRLKNLGDISGIDGIPILHEFEFEIVLKKTS